jgi:Pyridoxamine 5'-phosphate oxidase
VYETEADLAQLGALLEVSAAGAGPHLASISTPDRRLTAAQLSERLQGMRLLVVATVTADGRPLVGPVDGYFLRGSFYFSTGRDSVRMRHLAPRPQISATHVPGEELAVTVHGRAELFDMGSEDGSPGALLRQAMLDHYLPKQGPDFEKWLDESDAVGARIAAEKMFTFHMDAEPS